MKISLMRRLKVTYRPEAQTDFRDIYMYVLTRSGDKAMAEGFYQRIRTRCERIGLVPLGGRPRDDLEPGLRTVPFERTAVIAYKVEDESVRVTNIFYGGRDYEAIYHGVPEDEDERQGSDFD